jgi:hypothetical protein
MVMIRRELPRTSTSGPKFVRGSDDGCEYPGDLHRQHLEDLVQGPTEAGLLPAAGVRRALEGPVVDGDATQARVTDGVCGWS